MKKTIIILLSFVWVIFSSCGSSEVFRLVPPSEFKSLISRKKVQLLDVRTAEEHKAGCIPGSFNVDVKQQGRFLSNVDSLLSRHRVVALYCRSGKRSKVAASILSKAGFKVVELDGGYNAWKEKGF